VALLGGAESEEVEFKEVEFEETEVTEATDSPRSGHDARVTPRHEKGMLPRPFG
jgi:hypothetical protein